MANPWAIPATGWFLGWLLSPVFIFLWNKFFAYLAVDTWRKLGDLEKLTLPKLKGMLRDTEEKIMMGTGTPQSELVTLDKIAMDLKSALYEAEDILDEVDYLRIEKKIKGDRGWVQHLLSAAGASITHCKGTWFGTWVMRTRKILQCAKQRVGAALSRSSEPEQLPVQTPPNPAVQRIRARSESLDIKALCLFMLRCITKAYAALCFYRDWSYEVVGINKKQKDGIALDSFRLTIDGKSLRERIEQIEYTVTTMKKSHLLNQKTSSTGTSVEDTNKESSSTPEEINDLRRSTKKVFGREEDRERICSMLRKGSEADGPSPSSRKPFFVVGIHGVTGYGKSTLARYVCDHEKAAEDKHFDPVMFIHVSQTFRIDKIFRDMLSEINKGQQSDTNGITALRDKLKEKLKGKRFLLVLDDLWVNDENQEEQDILIDTLSAGQCGSTILVTAQKDDAAVALGAKNQILISKLKEKDYLELFMHHARPDATDDDVEYQRIGSKIANKLHRSPIAAETVGKQLRRNTRISFWERTANADVLNKKTIGPLWWSYQQLSDDNIRRCFAYCSTFPKGYKLERDVLVRIWIAQGFINTRRAGTEELEDVGQRYIDELLTFSFLQEQSTSSDTMAIHDLLHELAERVAGSDFIRIDLNGSPHDIPSGVRHVFIETSNRAKIAEIAENCPELGNLRTLIIEECCKVTDIMEAMEVMKIYHDFFELLFTRLRKLRLLIVEIYVRLEVSRSNTPAFDLKFSFPASIGQMKHLRYLGFICDGTLVGTTALALPSTFTKLYQMQTIEFFPYCEVSFTKLYQMQTIEFFPYCEVSYPKDMSNLIWLRHISGGLLSCPNVGGLTSLQTLPWFVVNKEQGRELKQLQNLNKLRGTLTISGLGIVGSKGEALEAHLARKERLTKLNLSFTDSGTRDPDIVAEVLEGLCPPKDLVGLSINDYDGSRYPSWMLSRQHPDAPKRLQKLELCKCSRLASIPEDSELFTRLVGLHIVECGWDSLPENMERLVSLQLLTISGCHNIELLPTTLPLSLRNIQIHRCFKLQLLPTLPLSLRNIQILECAFLGTSCNEEGHEDLQKIQHIPEKDTYERKDEVAVPEDSKLFIRLLELRIMHCGWDRLPENMERLVSLKKLTIFGCRKIEFLPRLPQSLQEIEIVFCHKIEFLPTLPQSLQEIQIRFCSVLSRTCKEEGHQNWHKIQHIPKKYIF